MERLRLLRRLTARSAMRLRRCVARHGGRTPHPRSCPRLSAPRCSPLCTQASPSSSGGSGAVAGAERLKFYVMREGGADFTFVEVDAHADVAALKDAVLTKLQLGAPADTVTLAVKGVDEPLDSTLTLVTAITAGSLAPSAKLIATIHAPAAASVQRESRAERERGLERAAGNDEHEQLLYVRGGAHLGLRANNALKRVCGRRARVGGDAALAAQNEEVRGRRMRCGHEHACMRG